MKPSRQSIAARRRPAFSRRRKTISRTSSTWRASYDLQKPFIYPVRVSGQAFAARGIKDGDIPIANTAARPAHGKVVVAVLPGSFRPATFERRGGYWFLRPSSTKEALPVSDE